MTDEEKQKLEALRQENGIKNMYYTRYLSIRYVVALYFFVNLYWLLMIFLEGPTWAMLIPIAMAAFAALAILEQSRMNTREQKPARISQLFFKVTIGLNLFLILLAVLGHYGWLFPLFQENSRTVLALVIGQFVGILLATLMLYKMSLIDKQADRQYYRIQKYLASLKL